MARRRRRYISLPSRQSAASAIENLAVHLLADAEDDDEQDCADAIAIIAWQMRQDARSKKYGRRGPYEATKAEDFFMVLLRGFSDRWFRAWLRMDRNSFWMIHDLICTDPIFTPERGRPQQPTYHQLATFLIRMGAETAVKTASIMAIAEGSVYNHVHRVVTALRKLRDDWIKIRGLSSPREDQRAWKDLHFPGCVGSCDASYLPLHGKPAVNGFAYWCRKKYYALIMQATVDRLARFTSYELGWPGSVQDSRTFRNSDIWLNRSSYFNDHEYLLVDKGYPLTPFSIRPFTEVDMTNDPQEATRRRQWNQHLSSQRIAVEHAFGRLKGRFTILRRIPGHRPRRMFRIIEALVVVHNMLETWSDESRTSQMFDSEPHISVEQDGAQLDGDVDGDLLYRQGLYRRKQLLDHFHNASTV